MATASRRGALRMLVVALAATLTVSLAPTASAVAAPSEPEIRDRLEQLVNRARARHGLRRLRVNIRMQRYAKGHAELMALRAALFHDAALGLEVLLGASAWGENVGYTYTTSDPARALHRMFMNSPAHRDNLLRRRWTHMGIGIEKRSGRVYGVERFADAT